MSADNYFLIKEEDNGIFVVRMGFMSDAYVQFTESDPRFNSLKEAILYAQSEYTEYGYRILFKDKT